MEGQRLIREGKRKGRREKGLARDDVERQRLRSGGMGNIGGGGDSGKVGGGCSICRRWRVVEWWRRQKVAADMVVVELVDRDGGGGDGEAKLDGWWYYSGGCNNGMVMGVDSICNGRMVMEVKGGGDNNGG
ncbi:hypothetical protein Acr_00g0092180 [Actinidia rufa]|uniref:Uncharacterized protein n=1 Tax=Actinidia rufa TaxID=165716 RepID=A0A7J0DXE1_9ERIC|nr:hypothetical protein Acr_00g0092180 [Actinidia rufa]